MDMSTLLDALAVIDAAQDNLFNESTTTTESLSEQLQETAQDGLSTGSSTASISLSEKIEHTTDDGDDMNTSSRSNYKFNGCKCPPVPKSSSRPPVTVLMDIANAFKCLETTSSRSEPLSKDLNKESGSVDIQNDYAVSATCHNSLLEKRLDEEFSRAIARKYLRKAFVARKNAELLEKRLQANMLDIAHATTSAIGDTMESKTLPGKMRDLEAKEEELLKQLGRLREVLQEVKAHEETDSICVIAEDCGEKEHWRWEAALASMHAAFEGMEHMFIKMARALTELLKICMKRSLLTGGPIELRLKERKEYEYEARAAKVGVWMAYSVSTSIKARPLQTSVVRAG